MGWTHHEEVVNQQRKAQAVLVFQFDDQRGQFLGAGEGDAGVLDELFDLKLPGQLKHETIAGDGKSLASLIAAHHQYI